MGGLIFQLHQVSCQFESGQSTGQITALREVNLAITPGERVALIGPSGAGKSTLLSLLNGSLMPSAGQVTVLGANLQRLRPHQRRRIQRQIGMVHQQHNLVPNLTVIHNVNAGQLGRWSLAKAVGTLVWPQLWPRDIKTANQALAQVGIEDKLYARTDNLSGGQQQRVALARVLVQDPVAILADEPIASIDPARSHDLMALLRYLSDSTGKTLVISLHDIEFAFEYCTRLVGLRQGAIWFDAPPAQVTEAMVQDLYQLGKLS